MYNKQQQTKRQLEENLEEIQKAQDYINTRRQGNKRLRTEIKELKGGQ